MGPRTPSQKELPILELMREGVDYRFELKIRALSLKARPLANIELINANVEASKRLTALDELGRVEVTRSVLIAQEILRAATSSDVGAQDSPLTDYIIERMSPDETQELYKQYLSGVERVNPSLESLSEEEIRALVEQVKKSPNRAYALTELSFLGLRAICLALLKDGDLPQVSSSG